MRKRLAYMLAALMVLAGVSGGPSARARDVDLTPNWMTIPVIGVNAPVESVGLDTEGVSMALPSGGGSIAWFNLGSPPGTFGNAIMAGHVDYIRDAAVFWDLNKLALGDYVNVFTKDGQQWIYQVTETTWYVHDQAPVDQVFGWSVEPTLTLITCGGTFDSSTRNYDKRLVVVAKATWDWKSQLPPDPAAQPQDPGSQPPPQQSQDPGSQQPQQSQDPNNQQQQPAPEPTPAPEGGSESE